VVVTPKREKCNAGNEAAANRQLATTQRLRRLEEMLDREDGRVTERFKDLVYQIIAEAGKVDNPIPALNQAIRQH
jgi:hypothetical protein